MDEKLKKIDALALKFSTNRSEFINRCIDYAMARLESPEGQNSSQP